MLVAYLESAVNACSEPKKTEHACASKGGNIISARADANENKIRIVLS
jgi:hypothetical protein